MDQQNAIFNRIYDTLLMSLMLHIDFFWEGGSLLCVKTNDHIPSMPQYYSLTAFNPTN